MLTGIMSQALEIINSLVGNYAVSIIIFTIIVKLMMYPLSLTQTRSMKAIQALQPEVQKIQQKYKDNKEKQAEEVNKLYLERGVNPLSGFITLIITLIITMIIIFPLYRAIFNLDMTETSFLWIKDLSRPDLILVLLNVLAMVGQTYLTTKFSGSAAQNNMMMWMMPIMILIIGFRLPAGVLIYWLTQTILSVLQQYIIEREPGNKGVEKKE